MKWEEIRKQYPNTFVKFEVLEYHIEDDKEVVDELALISVVKDVIVDTGASHSIISPVFLEELNTEYSIDDE